ncbi:MAG: imelysin family protein [Bacteroidota bacterium]
MNLKLIAFVPLAALLIGSQSCGDAGGNSTTSQGTEDTPKQLVAAASNYADIVLASYEDSYQTAVVLRDAINHFVDHPSEEQFLDCKNKWLQARIPYGQTEAYRFYGGPIDDKDGPEGLINAWPMDENFIDYVEGMPEVGLINDPASYPTIDKALLSDLNEKASEESIFTGYHAIEFLLWGQDLSASSAGQRPYTDYLTTGGTAKNQERRGLYLKTVADLLVDHLGEVKEEWKADGAYRTSFLGRPNADLINNIFGALSKLSKGELSGERMFVAVDSKDQENEHSCFADNTIADIQQNFQGLVNVYTGSYSRTNGTVVSGQSYRDIAAALNAPKAKAVDAAIATARSKINTIPSPFDQAILNNSEVVLEAVTALEDLSDAFADVAVDLGAQ